MSIGIKGDFTGFTYNDIHCSKFGLTRVSEGNRYNETFLPTLQDKTVEVPGGNGTYYFESNYTNKIILVSVAFDGIQEKDFVDIKRWLGTKKICRLIFDEKPYKYYMAKIQSPPEFKYICFDESNKEGESDKKRIYKGEGTITFICYYPFAKSVFRYLSEYKKLPEGAEEWKIKLDFTNIEEWSLSTYMLEDNKKPSKTGTQYYDIVGENETILINKGDLPCDYKLYINGNFTKLKRDGNVIINLTIPDGEVIESYICYNTKNNLLEGCDENYNPTGKVYNKYINEKSNFDKIDIDQETTLSIDAAATSVIISKIEYEYIYY